MSRITTLVISVDPKTLGEQSIGAATADDLLIIYNGNQASAHL